MRAHPVLAGLLLSVTTLAQAPTTLFDPAQTLNRLIFVTSPLTNAHSTLSRDQGFALIDTHLARAELGGLTINPLAPPFEVRRARGDWLEFELQVLSEAHAAADDNHDGRLDRAGVSVVLLDADHRGIELAFWPQRIWAQDDGKRLFTQAEGVDTPTTDQPHRYQLRLVGERYELSKDGRAILSGRVRDYSTFKGSPNVYALANFIYLGDDSTRSGAVSRLGRVTLHSPER